VTRCRTSQVPWSLSDSQWSRPAAPRSTTVTTCRQTLAIQVRRTDGQSMTGGTCRHYLLWRWPTAPIQFKWRTPDDSPQLPHSVAVARVFRRFIDTHVACSLPVVSLMQCFYHGAAACLSRPAVQMMVGRPGRRCTCQQSAAWSSSLFEYKAFKP
jgi:hypothetical protein